MVNKSIFFFVIILTLSSCNRAKNKARELVEQTKETLKEELSQIMTEDLEFRTTTFNDEFSPLTDIRINDLDGIYCELPVAFYYGFLQYRANSDSIMTFISNIETRLMDISNTSFYEIDQSDLNKNILQLKEIYGRKINKEIAFFEKFNKLESFKIFKCKRYPNSHVLIVDQKSDTIYHHFEKYWD